MSDEEKAVLKTAKENYGLTSAEQKILVNLIEKQSKEIEELKEKNRQGKMRIVQLENEITARIEDVNKYFTPNDKIKAKIEVLDKAIAVNRNSAKNADRVTVRLINDKINELKKAMEVLGSLLEKE